MITGTESFSVVITPDANGDFNFQMDINKVSVEHLYRTCYAICKKIEEGSLASEIKPLHWQSNNLN